MIRKKNFSYRDRIRDNNMMFLIGDTVKIKSRDELIYSGTSRKDFRAIRHLCDRVVTISEIINEVYYKINESTTPINDADIAHMVI